MGATKVAAQVAALIGTHLVGVPSASPTTHSEITTRISFVGASWLATWTPRSKLLLLFSSWKAVHGNLLATCPTKTLLKGAW